jgi:2'-5' RNA ligase superfamily
METRRQLTLFVPNDLAVTIESVRSTFNPAQFALIKSHVTLCREHELEPLEAVLHPLRTPGLGALEMTFGAPKRFAEGRGVLLPAVGGLSAFRRLRERILTPVVGEIQEQEPHLTLMHPRNATCTDAIFEALQQYVFPTRVTFDRVALIEQTAGAPWVVLEEFGL